MVFGYDTDISSGGSNQTRIRDIARSLLVEIRNERQEDDGRAPAVHN